MISYIHMFLLFYKLNNAENVLEKVSVTYLHRWSTGIKTNWKSLSLSHVQQSKQDQKYSLDCSCIIEGISTWGTVSWWSNHVCQQMWVFPENSPLVVLLSQLSSHIAAAVVLSIVRSINTSPTGSSETCQTPRRYELKCPSFVTPSSFNAQLCQSSPGSRRLGIGCAASGALRLHYSTITMVQQPRPALH